MYEQFQNDLCNILATVAVNMAIAGLGLQLTQEQANASRDNVQKCMSVEVTDKTVMIYIDSRTMETEPHLYGAVVATMATPKFRTTVDQLFAKSSKPEINCLKPYLFFR